MRRQAAGQAAGSSVPGGGDAGRRTRPYLGAGVDSSRAPSPGVRDRKITARGGPGKGGGWPQDKVGGSISTARTTLPSLPGLFGKLLERK